MQVVNELRRECAGKDNLGRARTSPAVAWSLQRYLIFAILCCIPGIVIWLDLGRIPPRLASVSLCAACCWVLSVGRCWRPTLCETGHTRGLPCTGLL